MPKKPKAKPTDAELLYKALDKLNVAVTTMQAFTLRNPKHNETITLLTDTVRALTEDLVGHQPDYFYASPTDEEATTISAQIVEVDRFALGWV